MGCSGLLVLIVEDEAMVRDALSEWLKQRGFCIITAADCASGLDLATRRRPRVIILDLKLGNGDGGLTLLRALRAIGLQIPCVVFTASTSPVDGFDAC